MWSLAERTRKRPQWRLLLPQLEMTLALPQLAQQKHPLSSCKVSTSFF